MADLEKSLRRKRRLAVVRERREADVVVVVESRESHWETGGVNSWTDSKGKTHVYNTVNNERVVHAVLEVGEYKMPLHGENIAWTGASDEVARQVDKWVDTNLVRLIARREGGKR